MLNRQTCCKAILQGLTLSTAMAFMLSCASHKVRVATREHRKAKVAIDECRYEDAIAEYHKILRKNAKDLEAKLGLQRASPLAAEKHLLKAKEASKHRLYQEELDEVTIALMQDPSNAMVADLLVNLNKKETQRRIASERDNDIVETARLRVSQEIKVLPAINPRSLESMELNLRKVELRDFFVLLGKSSGVNIMMHSSLDKSILISIDLRGLSFQRLLDVLMMQNDLFYKVIDANSIMVFKKNDATEKEHGQKLVQTFYLSNVVAKDVVQVINKIIPDVRAICADERIKTLTVMAKPSEIEVIKRIVDQMDKAKAEVMIYLELIEVSEDKREEFGFKLGNPSADDLKDPMRGYAIGGTAGTAAILKATMTDLTPELRLELAKAKGNAKILSQPNILVTSDESASIHIGEKISIQKDTVSNGSSSSESRVTSVYEDVGVKIKVKPIVHLNGDITVDLDVEISNTKPSSSSSSNPNLGTRIIKTKARLRDGEKTVFAGFFKEEDTKNLIGPSGLHGALEKVSSHHQDHKQKMEIMLSLRTVLVRTPDLHESDFESFDPRGVFVQTKPFDPKTTTDDVDSASDSVEPSTIHQSEPGESLPAPSNTDISVESAKPGK